MSFLRLDYYAARLCEATEPYSHRIRNLLDNPILAVEQDNCTVWVGETPTHNVMSFGCEQPLERLGFASFLSSLKELDIDSEGNMYQLSPALFELWADICGDSYGAMMTLHYKQANEDGVNKPWLLTGHGVGGQLAQLAAASYKPATLITFGSPLAGGPELSDVINDSCRWDQWEFAGDWTSFSPRRLLRQGGDEGSLRYITADGKLDFCRAVTYRKPADWFKLEPMSAFVDWIEDAL